MRCPAPIVALLAVASLSAGCGRRAECEASLAGTWNFSVTYKDAKSNQIDAVGSALLADAEDGSVTGSWSLVAQSLSTPEGVGVTRSEVVTGTAVGNVSTDGSGVSFSLTLAAPQQRTVAASGQGSCPNALADQLSGVAAGNGVSEGSFSASRAR